MKTMLMMKIDASLIFLALLTSNKGCVFEEKHVVAMLS